MLFALSCFAILLYLWIAFGGPSPLKPKGYQFDVKFPEAVQLATESDVRISGVTVGKVKRVEPDHNRTLATIQLQPRYSPLASDARAMLRTKSLLGETFVELSPGTKGAEPLQEGAMLRESQIAETVELDEIFRAFDKKTRRAFQDWFVYQAAAFDGRGETLNQAFATLPLFFTNANDLFTVLERQDEALNLTIRNTGEVFGAFSERKGELRNLIVNANKLFKTTAKRDDELAEIFRQFPGFIQESKKTVVRTTEFGEDNSAFIDQMREFARAAEPTFRAAVKSSPEVSRFFRQLDPLLDATDKGVPATQEFLKETRPVLAQLDTFLRDFNPMLQWIGNYQREITAFFANDSAATQGEANSLKYLRVLPMVNPETLAYFPKRLESNRANPYRAPGGYEKLVGGLEVFEATLCNGIALPPLDPEPSEYITEELKALIEKYIYREGTNPIAPPCKEQAPFEFDGRTTQYPQLHERSTP